MSDNVKEIWVIQEKRCLESNRVSEREELANQRCIESRDREWKQTDGLTLLADWQNGGMTGVEVTT